MPGRQRIFLRQGPSRQAKEHLLMFWIALFFDRRFERAIADDSAASKLLICGNRCTNVSGGRKVQTPSESQSSLDSVLRAALTIAMMPARIALGSSGQTTTNAARSGHRWAKSAKKHAKFFESNS